MNNLNEQFGQVYDQYIDKIYRFVYLKVSSQEVAEDITSKVFIKGWEAFKNGTNESRIKNYGAFLYQIARNAVIDHYRQKGRSKVVSVDDSPEISDSGESPQDKAILSADVDAIRKSIKKLKKEYQDVIIWHYLEDMPIANIAELIDKPAGTVRVMLHRGLKDLKDIVKEA
jgi:RNA polymerase sigma-70 factor (ECF subfamily)